jgi:hypothetical protein
MMFSPYGNTTNLLSSNFSFDGLAKILHLLRCAPRRKYSWGTNFLLLRRTSARRNNRKSMRLAYEAFYLAIDIFFVLPREIHIKMPIKWLLAPLFTEILP